MSENIVIQDGSDITEGVSRKYQRLVSLDALRGFDMFWIIGGDALVRTGAKYFDWPWLKWFAGQMHHPHWIGFTFYDTIFPMFLFIAGVAIPFSLLSKLERGVPRSKIYLRVTRRAIMLILLGIIYNGGLTLSGWSNTRYASVLGLIGVGYFFAAIITLNFKLKGQILWFLGILLVAWGALFLVPVPKYGAGVITPEGSLAAFLDQKLLPGKLYFGVYDPEGILSCFSGISMALAGVLTGQWLRREDIAKWKKLLGLLAGGVVCVLVARGWSLQLPIIKKIWTGSFILMTAGWSLLWLSLFYFVIEICRLRRWAIIFVVIGMNPITIYVGKRIIDFPHAADFLFGGFIGLAQEPLQPFLFSAAVLLLEILFLYFLYRKKVFLRV